MNKENDKEKVIGLAYKYIVEKMKYDLKSDEADHLKRIITPFVKDVTSLELFNFFPFEIMTPEMLAEFCAEHLIMRGATNLKINDTYDSKDKSTTDGSKDKSTTNLRQIMDNLKKGRYGSLIESGAVDSFIINKEKLADIFTRQYDGCVPDYLDDFMIDYVKQFKYNTLQVNKKDGIDFINPEKMIKELKKTYCDFYIYLQSLLFCAEGHPLDFIGWEYWRQKVLRCMVVAVNHIIYETMILFISEKDWIKLFQIKNNPEHIKALLSNKELSLMSFKDYHSKIHGKVDNTNLSLTLDRLSKFINDSVKGPINLIVKMYRTVWFENNKPGIGKLMTQELSLKFAYYLHGIIHDGYNYDIFKIFHEADQKDKNPYNEDFEASAYISNEQKNFVSESKNPSVRDRDFENCIEIAKMFYPTNGFDARDKDFIHIVKIFYQELYVHPVCIRDKNGNRILARNIIFDRENLPFNREIFLQTALDHAHFRKNRQLDVYMKFYDVLNKLWKITEMSYLTLDAETGLDVLRQILFKYLKFYDDFS